MDYDVRVLNLELLHITYRDSIGKHFSLHLHTENAMICVNWENDKYYGNQTVTGDSDSMDFFNDSCIGWPGFSIN